jgi:hypothetical protein
MNNWVNERMLRILGRHHFTKEACTGLAVTGVALAVACAGGATNTPIAATPAAPSASTAAPATPEPSAVPTAAASSIASAPLNAEAPPAAPEPKTPPDGGAPVASAAAPEPEPTTPASEILTAPKVAFVIDYANSEAKAKAAAACEKDPKKDDPEAKSACLQKARSKFLADVIVFHKGKKGHATLTIYKRNDSDLKEVFVAPVVFSNVTPHSVQLKFQGGSGQRPLFKNTGSPTLN